MDIKEIRELIALMRRNELTEFEMETEGFRIKLKKGGDPVVAHAPAYYAPQAAPAPAPAAAAPAAPATNGGEAAPTDARENASLAAMTAAILNGASIVRVHAVRPAAEAARIADAIRNVS